MRKLQRSLLESIGETPLVELTRFAAGLEGRILAKLEYLNPGASKKDRIALQMIEDAETDGRLGPGQTVVELTSGNTGTGLAIVCAVKGYRFVAVMSEGNSPERARMMRGLGAEVVLVPQSPGSVVGQVSGEDLALVEEETVRIVRDRGAFRADQFRLESNFRAHYLHTGPEVLQQSPYPIDVFCDFAGTGGTFGGCARAFKEANPETRCFVVEPQSPRHQIQGGGYGMDPLPQVRPGDVDGVLRVGDEEASECTRRLARTEGIFAGFSSGANLAVATRLLRGDFRGRTAVVVICDTGLKYLSTGLWV
jgi:cysteine synthase A